MIRMAATGEIGPTQTPRPHDTQVQYVWAPQISHSRKPRQENLYLSDDDDFEFSTINDVNEKNSGSLEEAPFKFPEHDTIINTARQLSNLASRQSSRAERGINPGWSFHHNQEAADERRLSKIAAQLTSSRSQREHHGNQRSQHVRSASLTGPTYTLTGNRKSSSSRRLRSKSANNAPIQSIVDSYPPPPVKVHVTKEAIRSSTAGSGKTQLRYTSHWDS